MAKLILFLIKIIFFFFRSKKSLISENIILKKKLQIKNRKYSDIRKQILDTDRIIFSILNILSNIKEKISIVKPETLLKWQRELIKNNWNFISRKNRFPGRPKIETNIRQLILQMKNQNIIWGSKKIHGELGKLAIFISLTTVKNILIDFRRKGKIKKSLTWSTFLKSNIKSVFAMDFFTIDTILNKRFYVFFIIRHKTREIVQFSITTSPVIEFVKQQIIGFENNIILPVYNTMVYMIYDRAPQFFLDYNLYHITGIRTSVKAPNMNSIAERFIRSVRRECLDWFLLLSENQIMKLLTEYIKYYNFQRAHQGINQCIPKGYSPRKDGKIIKFPVLSGLYYHYERKIA